jgi:hypothetical protein
MDHQTKEITNQQNNAEDEMPNMIFGGVLVEKEQEMVCGLNLPR